MQKKRKKALRKLLQFSEKSIREGKVYDIDQIFSELRKKSRSKENIITGKRNMVIVQ